MRVQNSFVKCSNFLEFKEFQNSVGFDFPTSDNNTRSSSSDLSYSEKLENREQSLARTRSLFRYRIFANPDLRYFMTLTFADNITDIDKANSHFTDFIEKLRYRYPNFKYVAVIEHQKRGAIHYHLLYNQRIPFPDRPEAWPSLPEGEALWPHGYSRVEKPEKDRLGMFQYLGKYLNKVSADDERLWGKKCFWTSHNLNGWIRFVNQDIFDIAEIVRRMIDKYNGRFVRTKFSYQSEFGGYTTIWRFMFQ